MSLSWDCFSSRRATFTYWNFPRWVVKISQKWESEGISKLTWHHAIPPKFLSTKCTFLRMRKSREKKWNAENLSHFSSLLEKINLRGVFPLFSGIVRWLSDLSLQCGGVKHQIWRLFTHKFFISPLPPLSNPPDCNHGQSPPHFAAW